MISCVNAWATSLVTPCSLSFSISGSFIIDACPLPVLHGVSAFGTKLCFYSITKEGLVSPEYIPASPQCVTDTAPVVRWSYDILTVEGEAELRRIVQAIITECAHLPQSGKQGPVFKYRHAFNYFTDDFLYR
jgi:hypothetical protein